VLALERLESLCRAGWCGSRAAPPSLRDGAGGATLDARQPVRPSFHQAHQGVLSPSEGLTPSVVAGGWGDWEEAGRREFPQKFDGEIKAPGPFRSM